MMHVWWKFVNSSLTLWRVIVRTRSSLRTEKALTAYLFVRVTIDDLIKGQKRRCLLARTNCWTNSRIIRNFTRHEAHVTSLHCIYHRTHPHQRGHHLILANLFLSQHPDIEGSDLERISMTLKRSILVASSSRWTAATQYSQQGGHPDISPHWRGSHSNPSPLTRDQCLPVGINKFNTMRPGQIVRHFADIFRGISLNENFALKNSR